MLRSTEGEAQIEGVIIAFAVRLAGTGLVLWANLVSVAAGTPLDFRSVPASAGIYLLIAAGLRLGVLPLHLPYRKENVIRRGLGTALRLVSAASSLALLARIPATALKSALTPYLLILAAIAALYAGWMWFRVSDEILGRPFWILGLAPLAVAESLRGNPTGSTGWGAALILCGGALPVLGAPEKHPVAAFPGSVGAFNFALFPDCSGLAVNNGTSWLFIIPFLPAQALLMAGFLPPYTPPWRTSLESQEKWVKAIYPTGLLILIATTVLLGLWGWDGARTVGAWWLAIVVILLAAGFTILSLRILVRIPSSNPSGQWTSNFSARMVLFSIEIAI